MNENSKVSASEQIAAKIKSSSNILITVSRDPNIDQLAAALALTLALDKMAKHATSVVSGSIPPAINFLEPEKTFENNADSLRDFIISLDKSKADHLRFKVEGDIVKVLITPYKTTISESDLSFSEGEFNVELVIAIGVDKKDDLDAAIAAHGRILHDATVVTINANLASTSLGSINWQDSESSGFSEMATKLIQSLDSSEKPMIDEQVANALLTGLVATTDQFRNDKTSPSVMTLAANLMAKGANQQLVSSELSTKSSAASDQPAGSISSGAAHSGELSLDHGASSSPRSSEIDRSAIINAEGPVAAPPERDGSVTEQINAITDSESNRLATVQSNDALAAAQSQLAEITSTPSLANDTTASEAALDNVVANSGSSNVMNDLKSEAPYRGSTYVEEKISNPINSAMQSDEPQLVNPLFSDAGPAETAQGSTMISSASAPATGEEALQTALSAATAAETANSNMKEAQNSSMESVGSATATNMPPLPPANFDLPLPPPPPMPLPDVGTLPPVENASSSNAEANPASSDLSGVYSGYHVAEPAPAEPSSPNPSDPGQFQIPS